MQKEIAVWSRRETVTIVGSVGNGVFRVIWHPSTGGPDQELRVSLTRGETLDEAIARTLRKRVGVEPQSGPK